MALDHDDQNDRPRFHQPNWAVGGDAYNVAGNVTNNYYPPATAPLSAQQLRDRRTMLAKVRAIWIDGLLDHSLAQALRIELGLTTQPGAVDLALPKLVQELNQPARELPAGTSISAVFGQVGGALLILGAPGAGKTTLLLELARDLLARAEADDAHPIPVVFNLSTWAANPTTLAAWLVDELSQRYDVPRKTAQQWIAADAVLPLLDGLDEVAAAQRNDCVVAINQYHNEQGFVPLAVCSRAGDYSELDYKLRLHNAVLVQPLTPEQVAAYLQQGGDQLAGLRAALGSDKALAELLDTPLMLSIAALAYAGAPAAALAAATPEQQRRQLFDAYIAAMYRRRGAQPAYPAERTTRWLAWLAAQLVAHSQTVYYIERMQPDWLPSRQRRRYHRLTEGLMGKLAQCTVWWIARRLGLETKTPGENIELSETLRWSWSNALSFGLSFGLLGGLIYGLSVGLLSGLSFGLTFGLLSGLFFLLLGGLSANELGMYLYPNQGIIRSARNGFKYGLLGGVGFGFFGSLIFRLFQGVNDRINFGLVFGIVFGINIGLQYGGNAAVQHYILRWLLARNGGLPFRDRQLISFLDYCAGRIFLRKVGGGYIFVHRLLMEHFARMDA